MKLFSSLVLLVLLSFASTATALDLCYTESTTGARYAFKKVKVPKQGEDALPLLGVKNGVLGVFGTLFRFSEGALGLNVVADGCFVTGTLDTNFDGDVTQNCEPIGGGIVGYTWTRVDCDADI